MSTIQKVVNTGVQGAKHLAEGVGHTVEDVARQVGDRVEHLSTGAKAGILTLTTAGLVNAPAFADGVQQAAQTCAANPDWNAIAGGTIGAAVFLSIVFGAFHLVSKSWR